MYRYGSFGGSFRHYALQGCALLLLILAWKAEVYSQISPGELSKAHENLNGPIHCTDCHDSGVRPPAFNCLKCHRDIRERLDQRKGLHFTLVGKDESGRSCAKCHPDHYGPSFDLIHWTPSIEQFDHKRTGYALEGKQAQVACRTCHRDSGSGKKRHYG
jgi:hypothetical protein